MYRPQKLHQYTISCWNRINVGQYNNHYTSYTWHIYNPAMLRYPTIAGHSLYLIYIATTKPGQPPLVTMPTGSWTYSSTAPEKTDFVSPAWHQQVEYKWQNSSLGCTDLEHLFHIVGQLVLPYCNDKTSPKQLEIVVHWNTQWTMLNTLWVNGKSKIPSLRVT